MDITFIVSMLTVMSGTGFFTFLFTRSKYKVDVLQAKENAESTALDNDIKRSNHYKDMLDDLDIRYEKKYQEFESIIQRKVGILEEEIKMRDRKIKLLEREIAELKKENKQLKNGSRNQT